MALLYSAFLHVVFVVYGSFNKLIQKKKINQFILEEMEKTPHTECYNQKLNVILAKYDNKLIYCCFYKDSFSKMVCKAKKYEKIVQFR